MSSRASNWTMSSEPCSSSHSWHWRTQCRWVTSPTRTAHGIRKSVTPCFESDLISQRCPQPSFPQPSPLRPRIGGPFILPNHHRLVRHPIIRTIEITSPRPGASSDKPPSRNSIVGVSSCPLSAPELTHVLTFQQNATMGVTRSDLHLAMAGPTSMEDDTC